MGESAGTPRVRVDLLGRFRVTLNDGSPTQAISARGQELLALLVLENGARLARERVASRLWPDSGEAQARTNLRRELHQLRRTLPRYEEVIQDEGADLSLRLTASPVLVGAQSDVQEVRAALGRSTAAKAGPAELDALIEAARGYCGDLLPECFAEWLAPERERLRHEIIVALRRLTELLEHRRDLVEGLRWARRLTELDPLDEIAYRAEMRLCAAASDRAAALHAFHRCAQRLDRELGVEPAPETRVLYRRLVEQPAERATALRSPQARAFVGRQSERERLLQAWRSLDATAPLLACITGEPGIGKSRLADEVARHAERDGARVAWARAYAAEGQLSYAPVVEWLRSPALAGAVKDLELPWRAELGRLLPETDGAGPAPAPQTPADGDDAHRRRVLFEAVSKVLRGGTRPTLLLLDDLQWCDPQSLSFLHYLGRPDTGAPLFILATARSGELADNAEARRLLLALLQEGRQLELELTPFGTDDLKALLGAAGHDAAPEIVERVRALSEGNPLFALEALQADLHLRALEPAAEPKGALLVRSPRVRGVLTTRLAQLGPRARELAEYAATIGRAFDVDVLREAADLDEGELVSALDELWRRRIVREHAAGAYDFTHDALREAATFELSPSRARLLHRRVAQAFELVRAASLDDLSSALATHYELAGLPERATTFYRRAARAAASRYAHDHASALLERGLSLVAQRPSSRQRDGEELGLLLERAPSLRALKGYANPELVALLHRARALAEGLNEAPALFQVLRNLWAQQFVAGDLPGTLETAYRMFELASVLPQLAPIGHHALAGALTHVGQLAAAIDHFEAARAGYDPKDAHQHLLVFGSDLGVFNSAWEAHALWLYGLEDRAVTAANEAVQTARTLGHAYSEALAQAYAAVLHYMRRDRRSCAEASDAARELCHRHGFAYYGHWGTLLGAWARNNDPSSAAEVIAGALAALDAEGSWARRPLYLAALVEVLAEAGRRDEALVALRQAEERAERSGDCVWSAELMRLRAVLVPGESLLHARRARDLAARLKARPLVVRTSVTLTDAMTGDREGAVQVLREALADLPDSGGSLDRDVALQRLRSLERPAAARANLRP
jgi:DNA-binding SARP family transcriptional activator/tetratricopeptide (TPR) repeat protein